MIETLTMPHIYRGRRSQVASGQGYRRLLPGPLVPLRTRFHLWSKMCLYFQPQKFATHFVRPGGALVEKRELSVAALLAFVVPL